MAAAGRLVEGADELEPALVEEASRSATVRAVTMSWVTTTEVVWSRMFRSTMSCAIFSEVSGIEARRRLVVQDDLGLEGDRPGERDALAHAARELRRHLALDARQADHRQLLGHDRGDLCRRLVGVLARAGNAMFSSTFIESKSAPPWKSIATRRRTGDELLLREADDRLAEHLHVALVGLRQAVDVPQRDALAGARGPEDAEHLAAADLQVDAGEDVAAGVALPDLLELDDRSRPWSGARGRRERSRKPGRAHQIARKSFVRKKSEIEDADRREHDRARRRAARPPPRRPRPAGR